MIAAQVDLLARVTEPFYIEARMNVVDEDGVDLGPIDFTDADIRMHVRKTADASHIDLLLTVENGRIIIMTPSPSAEDSPNLALSVSQGSLRSIAAQNYVYDLRYWDGPVLLFGKLTFVQGVTR